MNKDYNLETGDVLFSFLAVVVISAFSPLFIYFQNVHEMAFSDILKPLFVSTGIGLFLFVLSYLLLRSIPKAALFSTITFFTASNYIYLEKVIQKLFPSLRYCQIVILMLLFFYFLTIFSSKILNQDLGAIFLRVLTVIFTLILAFDFINNAKEIRIRKAPNTKNEQSVIPEKEKGSHPNIYYLLFDEYAGFNQIKNRFGYDNSEFAAWLEERGFTVSYDSHNESTHTEVVTTNIVNLEYKATLSTDNSIDSRKDSPLFNLLKKYGYQIAGGPGTEFYGLEPVFETSAGTAQTIEGNTAADLVLGNSILYPFFERKDDKLANEIMSSFDVLKHPEQYPLSNTFVLAHLNAPHIPYVFQADGTINTHTNLYNQSTPFYYVQYHHFVTGQIKEIAEAILNADPNAVIILTSDHGCRYMTDTPFEERTDILNAVYYQGEKIEEIQGLSAVNTLRCVLNRLLGTGYEMLEVPQYEE